MKANKFFAIAFAALTMVGLNACKDKNNGGDGNEPSSPDQEAELALNPTSLQLEVGQEGTITATIEVAFETSNPAAATVTPANDGKSAKVTAVAEGSAVITAKSKGGQVKTCIVAVKKAGGEGGGAQLKGSQVWPIILDGTTAEANASKIVATLQPNDVDQHLWLWDNTYIGGTASGMNFHGNSDGYCALVVTTVGWSGGGFCLDAGSAGLNASEELRKAIVANPDQYFLHLAIKSTDQASHTFYTFGNDGTKFVIGNTVFDGGFIVSDFARDGAWHEFDIPMSSFASALASKAADSNVFVMLSGGVQGTQLNLDAVYFYKK